MAISIAGEWVTTGQTAEFGRIEFRSPDLILKGETMTEANLSVDVGFTGIIDNRSEGRIYRSHDSGATWTTGTTDNSSYDIPDNYSGSYRYYDTPFRLVEPGDADNNDRKEKEMIERQTFLDALADEGKVITSEQRELVRDATSDKWKLFVARLLARLVGSVDFETLKEKSKEVLIREAD